MIFRIIVDYLPMVDAAVVQAAFAGPSGEHVPVVIVLHSKHVDTRIKHDQ